MAPRKAPVVAEVSDEDLLPENRPEELPPESGTAVPRPIPVRYTIVGPLEGTEDYDPGDVLVHDTDEVVPYDAAAFNRRYRVVQGEDTESVYEERFPKFSTGGTAYVRVVCPDCDQTALFSVEVGELRTSGDKSTLKPTFKATAKEHHCGQVSARLEDHEDADGPSDGVSDAGSDATEADDGDD